VHVIAQWDSTGQWAACPTTTCANGGFSVSFANGDKCNGSGPPRTTKFLFQCPAAGAVSVTTYSVASVGCDYTITMVNNIGCGGGGGGGGSQKKLSGGSIFLIILVVLIPVYVIAGCIYKRQVKGTSGTESCPNVDFWRDLPSLIGDGFKFTWRKCLGLCGKGGDAYDTMK